MSHHGCPERLSNRSKGFQEDGAGQTTMEVLVETLTGTAFEMTVSPTDTVFAIKSKICRVEGIPVSQQHLVYNLRELEDCASLGALGIADGARLRLVLGMRGGPVSSRRLPPPPEPWPRADSRDDSDWGGRCRVTVVVFRDGERLNMLRVTENPDGSYSPIDHNYSSPVPCSVATTELGAGSLAQNAVTMGKMQDIRRRMESLHIRRKHHTGAGAVEQPVHKTRSEESLLGHALLDELAADRDTYARYEYECVDRYTLLPPLPHHPDTNAHAPDADRLSLPARGLLAAGCGDARAPLLAPPPPPHPHPHPLHVGPLVGGQGGWRVGGAGGAGAAGGAGLGAAGGHARSASSLVRGVLPEPGPALQDAVFSSSTSDLEQLRRNRLLPALCRHRNTEHLHLSDEMLHRDASRRRIDDIAELERAADDERVDKREKEKKPRMRCVVCRKKLSVSSAHVCGCGSLTCAPHRYPDTHACAAPALRPHPPPPPSRHHPKLPKI